MESWLEWARGPVFIFSITFLVLGLIRHVAITLWEMSRTMHRAGDKQLPYRQALKATAKWLVPVEKVRNEPLFSATSVLFHVGALLVPLFLGGHVVLMARGLGFAWPALPGGLADVLTILTIVTAVALVLQRLLARATRQLSRLQDYLLPLVVALPFATGFLAMHPALNPFGFEAMLFTHVMSGNLVLVLIPITKLSHAVLLPSVQLVSEMGWRWPADSGRRVAAALKKEEEPV